MQEITYRENIQDSKEYKEIYVKEIRNIIERREQAAIAMRDNYCSDIFHKQEKYREDFKAMLGWPLTEKQALSVPSAKIKKLTEEKDCSIYRVSIEVMDGFSMTGLLFQKDEKKRPLVIAQHGGLGTPELLGNLYGDTTNYNHMIERILSYNVNVFAPQLLIWAPSYEVEFDRGALDAQLKRVYLSQTEISLTKIIGKAEITVCKSTGVVGHDGFPFGL